MNAADVVKYGHLWVLKHVDGLTDAQWETPGVCGWWSVKEIVAHLASYEQVLGEVFSACLGESGPTPTLDRFKSMDGDAFNALEVESRTASMASGARQACSPAEVLADYTAAAERAMALLPRIPPETLRQPGTIPWYGMEYALDDFIVYAFYGHKREHCAQVAVYRDRL